MSQTPEDRIRLHYKSLRRQWGKDHMYFPFRDYWFLMARVWKRPVQEIKRIVKEGKT